MVYSATTFKHAFDYKPSDIYWYDASFLASSGSINLFLMLIGNFLQAALFLIRFPCLTCIRCTADCGWITGHSYVTYGPLLNGATVLVYEGVISENFLIDIMPRITINNNCVSFGLVLVLPCL